MNRVVVWLRAHEQRMFMWVNQRLHHRALNTFFSAATHLGGATFTIASSLVLGIAGKGAVGLAGWQALAALAASHVPVAVCKRAFPRLRPYQVWPQTKTGRNPLADHSFPSGHTTAIFSLVVPFSLLHPGLAAALLPLATLVGLSRMYLGLHYPSDCLVGMALGSSAGFISAAVLG
ncbi:phosphatase PAP2 family protein [Paenibacillus sp. y28]|uniref:phosphatase PAP2 family protein n=1 Tax=Paenibacillus sp. y28 TaxID=3129110 RepID=UPI003017918E